MTETEKDEFESEFLRYINLHPEMCREDTTTYDMLVNEYMTKCKETTDTFKYPSF